MKKLIMFVMVLMLCLGTAYADLPEPVSRWTFDGDASDSGTGGNNGTLEGTAAIGSDGERGDVLVLDGTEGAYVSTGAAVIEFSESYTVGVWVKTTATSVGLLGKSDGSGGGDEGWNSGEIQLFIGPDGDGITEAGEPSMVGWGRDYQLTIDSTVNDGEWHHIAVTYDAAIKEEGALIYVDGVDVSDPESGYDASDPLLTDNEGDTVDIGRGVSFEAEDNLLGSMDDVTIFDVVLDAAQIVELMQWQAYGPKNPIKVDPNQMDVYETDETEGNFEVSLKFPPLGQEPAAKAPDGTPISMEIIVDPNGFGGGGSSDITLIGGSGPHNRISFTRTTANWDVPEVIRFKAIDDGLAEPQQTGDTMAEAQNIVVWAVPTPYEPNLARPVAQKVVGGVVWDNDQANILFSVTPFRGGPKTPVIGPVQLFEQYTASDLLRWRKIFFKMQIKPVNAEDPCSPTEVKCNAVVEEAEDQPGGDNLPHTDPCLPYEDADDPNGFTFTSTTSDDGNGNPTGLVGDCPDWNTGTKTSCWDVPQGIKIWGNDDTVLQIEDAAADGDEDYHAVLIVTVVEDGGDERFTDFERTVDLDIEDNECGAYGILALDVSNPYYMTDPNWADDDPDCHVDIHDAIGIAFRWLNCSDPKDPNCTKYND